MSEKFVASNGVEVHINGYSQLCIGRGVPREHTQAAREFFQYERDTKLGRWRWPENPNFVVYPLDKLVGGTRSVQVLHEGHGISSQINKGDPKNMEARCAAAAYFAAHPVPKPWHDAKPGELWEVSISASGYNLNIPCKKPLPMQVMVDDRGSIVSHYFVHWNGSDAETIDIEDRHIEAAQRLWPEAVDHQKV